MSSLDTELLDKDFDAYIEAHQDKTLLQVPDLRQRR